ncbi:MAG: MMPL family transporter [Fuerstiella sp.]|nr:RND family transporter [Fuerstiella sp.]
MKTLILLRNYLLLAAVIAVLVSIPISGRLEFDQRIESFFADDNPDIRLLRRSRQDFGGDEFVVVAWTEDRLLDIEGDYPVSLAAALEINVLHRVDADVARRIHATTAQLNQIPGVNAEKTQQLPDMRDLRDPDLRFRNTRKAVFRLFEGTLIGRDGRTTGIVLELMSEAEAGISRAETLAQIRAVAESMPADVAVAGEPVQVFDMFRLVEEDGQILFLVSLAILSTVLVAMFRSLRWVLAPVGLVLGSVVATRAILYLVGAQLSMVSSMLNSLVTVIGIATCMHVIVHYRDLRRDMSLQPTDSNAKSDFPAVARQTLTDMAAPIFWTCVTTAVGFGSLLVSQITPVRSFSIMMCLATGVVLLGCFIILPATLGSGSRLRPPANVPMERWLDRALRVTCRGVEQKPLLTAVICLVLFVAAIPGVFRLTIETDFSKNFKESSSIVQSLKFIESRLGGAGSWEVSFDTPEKLTDDFLNVVKELTEELRALTMDDDSIRILSLTDVLSLPPRGVLGPVKTLEKATRKQPRLIETLYNEKLRRMRIVLRSIEQQSSENKVAQIAKIRTCVREFFASRPELSQTTTPAASGMFVLLAELIQSLLDDQLRSFVVATVGILACMTIAFRSLRIGLISLLPNIFPVAMVMGTLGWIGMPVNIGTAMITSVSMGLTVDSTIHYITAFERARRTTSVTEALQIAHAGAGRAVVFASLALVAGFMVLTASRFVPLVYFGALLSLSMIGGIFGDLVLLPLLLRWTTPVSSRDIAMQTESPDGPQTQSS